MNEQEAREALARLDALLDRLQGPDTPYTVREITAGFNFFRWMQQSAAPHQVQSAGPGRQTYRGCRLRLLSSPVDTWEISMGDVILTPEGEQRA